MVALNLPTPGGDNDTWGTLLNDALTGLNDSKVGKGELVLNVKDYGAVGDGVADDTAAISAALAAARPQKGRVRFEPNATYLVSSTLVITGCHLEGRGATLKIPNGADLTGVQVLQLSGGATIEGLAIDLNKANTTDTGVATHGLGIYCYGAAGWTDRLVIRDVEIKNGYHAAVQLVTGAAITDGADAPRSRTLLDNVRVTGCGSGVFASKVDGLTIRDSTFDTLTADGVWANLCNRLKVKDCTLTDATGHGIVTLYCAGQVISGNTASGCGDSGITLGGGSATNVESRYATVAGNICRGNTQHGITLDTTKSGASTTPVPLHATVAANVCEGNGTHGINATNSSHLAISGNVCQANTLTGINLSTADTTIDGNHCTGNGSKGVGLNGNASFPNYGRHRIGVNTVAGNTVGGYVVESASVTDVSWASLTTVNPAP